jgi:hypothetical protein
MTSVMNWLNQNRAVYFGNATSMRDFRVQLRGNRSVMLFGAYLVLLIGVAMFVYSQAVGDQAYSIVDAQSKLQNFYVVVMELLAGAICVVAPALSATTVVLEKQRQSLDLVFSAPVSPKYYLVGKMLSSYRYIWMMLVLSLPVTAACVVMGGASWSDVLGTYFFLSLQGLVLTSLSLLMSTLAPRPVSAVLWSYAICIPYLCLTGAGASIFFASSVVNASQTLVAPFTMALCPFTSSAAVGTFSVIHGVNVPNWIPAVVISLLIVKISLLCAGSLLNPSGKEASSLRLHGLLYMTGLLGFTGYSVHSYLGFNTDPGGDLGRILAWSFMPLFAIVPFMACYGFEAENRFKPDGMFKLRNLLKPTPATALPYLLTVITCSAAALMIGFLASGIGAPQMTTMRSVVTPGANGAFSAMTEVPLQSSTYFFPAFLSYFALTIAMWTFFWAVGRFTSSLNIGLKSARGLTFASFLLVCAVPVPLLVTMDHANALDNGASIWSLWVLRSMVTSYQEASNEAITYSAILVLLAIPISIYAETRLKELKVKRQESKATAQAA